ncbi:MAG TPA: BON domain-containing protein [Azospirillum sp.]|nr:BON domain-containing protein [Azospirillum sp.]
MRDYEDRWGRGRRDWDDTREYARRDYEYRGGSGTGGYRGDMDRDRSYGRGMERARDRGAGYAHGMMDDMRRYARGDYDRDRDDNRTRDYGGRDYGVRDYGSDMGSGYGEDRSYGYERDRSMGGRDYYGSGSYGRSRGEERDYGGRDDDRGFMERAGDEVASWFGDEDAERRRRMDEARGHRGRGPRGYTRSDDRIREDVSDRLTDDPYVDASDIDISVSNGEVTLTGHVDHRSAKRRAEDLAEAVSGVTHVQNNVRVRQSSGMGTGVGSATSAGASAMAGMGGTSGTTAGTGTTTGTGTTGTTTGVGTGAGTRTRT